VKNVTFSFETSPNKTLSENRGGDMAYYLPPSKKVTGTRPPRSPSNCAHDDGTAQFGIQRD